MPRWLLLLCAYLLAWVPLDFAALATAALPSMADRGAAAVVELAAHGAAALLCAAAGWMLWVRHAAGVGVARAALVVEAAVTVQGLFVSALPRDVAPGLAWPIAAVVVAHALAWLAYLARSRRLRAWLDGE